MMFQYQLTQDDLHKVFSRYGVVNHITVDEAGTMARITFKEHANAQAALSDLNGKVLNGLEGTLRISWAPAVVADVAVPAATARSGAMSPVGDAAMTTTFALQGAGPSSGGSAAGGGSTSGSPGAEAKASAHVKGVRKHTCRFLIGIENDKDFQVVRRIIGAKGANMKRIVGRSCGSGEAQAKLRLRGVGSGYFEGAGQRESSEPLQLCVSCTSAEGYKIAVRLVEELLAGVYAEHRAHCRDLGRPEPDLHPTPQLVSGRGRSSAPEAPDEDEGEGEEAPEREEGDDSGRTGRRRGRRARGRKGVEVATRGDPPPKAPPLEEIERLIDARNEARRQCNFAEADRLRQSLHERGVALMDEPGARGRGSEVTTWRYWRE